MFENKKIFILGMARSGYDAAKLLAKHHNEIVLNDKSLDQDEDKVKELESLGVKVILGSHPDDILDESFDYLINSEVLSDLNDSNISFESDFTPSEIFYIDNQ